MLFALTDGVAIVNTTDTPPKSPYDHGSPFDPMQIGPRANAFDNPVSMNVGDAGDAGDIFTKFVSPNGVAAKVFVDHRVVPSKAT